MGSAIGKIDSIGDGGGGSGLGGYPRVDYYADLPPYGDHIGEIYLVLNTTVVPAGDDLEAGLWEARLAGWFFIGSLLAAEIKERYESNPDTNAFTDAEKTKLAAVKIAYSHTQAVASATWTITHNLGYRPDVVCFSPAGVRFYGHIAYPNANTAVVSFASPQAGFADAY